MTKPEFLAINLILSPPAWVHHWLCYLQHSCGILQHSTEGSSVAASTRVLTSAPHSPPSVHPFCIFHVPFLLLGKCKCPLHTTTPAEQLNGDICKSSLSERRQSELIFFHSPKSGRMIIVCLHLILFLGLLHFLSLRMPAFCTASSMGWHRLRLAFEPHTFRSWRDSRKIPGSRKGE